MPLLACRFHPHSSPSVPFGLPFPRRCNTILVFSAHHLEGRQRRRSHRPGSTGGTQRISFTCCQDDAKRRAGCRKRGGPSSPERLQSALVCILVANSVSMWRTALRNEELVRSKVAPAPLSRSSGRCFADQLCLPQRASTSLWRPDTPILATLCAISLLHLYTCVQRCGRASPAF